MTENAPGHPSAVDRTVAALYEVFAGYPRFTGYVDCTHCVPERVQDALRWIPLRELSPAQLRPVANNAGVGTFGDANVYRHFLPRLLEVLLRGLDPGLSESAVLTGLSLHEASRWPLAEQRAVDDALAAWVFDAVPGRLDPLAAETAALHERVAWVAAFSPRSEDWPGRIRQLSPVAAVLLLEGVLAAEHGARILPTGTRAAWSAWIEAGASALGDDAWRAEALSATLRAR